MLQKKASSIAGLFLYLTFSSYDSTTANYFISSN